jgi:uncharacterized tellurite resistance protein B-like protein
MRNEFLTLGMRVSTNGKIEGHEVESLQELFFADGNIDRQEAEFLLNLYRRTDQMTPAFERFFCKVIKHHLLADGTIDSERLEWLRRFILADGKVSEPETKLLHEIKGEATGISVEGQALIEECLEWLANAKHT